MKTLVLSAVAALSTVAMMAEAKAHQGQEGFGGGTPRVTVYHGDVACDAWRDTYGNIPLGAAAPAVKIAVNGIWVITRALSPSATPVFTPVFFTGRRDLMGSTIMYFQGYGYGVELVYTNGGLVSATVSASGFSAACPVMG